VSGSCSDSTGVLDWSGAEVNELLLAASVLLHAVASKPMAMQVAKPYRMCGLGRFM
jgi:hypothetical protein